MRIRQLLLLACVLIGFGLFAKAFFFSESKSIVNKYPMQPQHVQSIPQATQESPHNSPQLTAEQTPKTTEPQSTQSNKLAKTTSKTSTFPTETTESVAAIKVDYKTLPTADMVEIIKSDRTLSLKRKGKTIRSYHIALGDTPKGHKVQEGDEKTPEGTYTLDWKNENSIAYRSIHVSYPNVQDKATAKKLGVSAGGDIMIHGIMNGFEHLTEKLQKRDWTDGCIAVTNDEMDEIMYLVKVGTKINIRW